MKKLLMIGAILVMGTMAFGADAQVDDGQNTNEATVTVKAKLVAENLEISDINGNPIVLDFGRVSKTRDKGTSEAQTGYMVRFVGTGELTDTNNGLEMSLQDYTNGAFETNAVPVRLASLTQVDGQKADSFEVTVGLNSYTGKMPKDRQDGHDYREYIGTIFGTLNHAKANANSSKGTGEGTLANLASGDYEGQTMLRVSINGGQEISNGSDD